MPSASNERQIKARESRHAQDRINDRQVTEALMSTQGGRRWVWLRLAEAQMFSEDEVLDPQHLAYTKGVRRYGLRLLKDISTFTPSEYILMTNEAQDVEASITRQEPNYVRSADDTDS